ncbi:hypothetical protein EDC65_2253 [Stella humosa]|uniref:Prohead serine protease n=1 Tax=Stella humosa TaxID=94 RepID=A0A3N1LZ07_9PROT|nr:hypothetical protein [Stella humosa]ROQ00454.1 hypothetical protein EDC65_2253 [Stella humosa]BBK30301.1 hypothetical protein STHU_09350 [Stella humosa]
MPDAHRTDLPMQVRAATLALTTANAEARTIELVWSTGARVRRFDYWRERYFDEELVLETGAVDLARLNGGANLLDCHGRWQLSSILGVVERAWLATGADGKPEGRAVVRFSDRAEVAAIWRDVQAGIIRNVSVGYMVRAFEMVERQGEVPLYRAIDWEPGEISLVPVGADPGAGTRSAGEGGSDLQRDPGPQRYPCRFIDPITRNEETDMTKPTPAGDPAGKPDPAAQPRSEAQNAPVVDTRAAPPATPPAPPAPTNVVDLDGARAQGRADALAYVSEVNELCALAGSERSAEFIAAGTPVAAVRKALLEARAADSAARGIVGAHAGTTTAPAGRGWGDALARAGVARPNPKS